jgi:hypothetical protein
MRSEPLRTATPLTRSDRKWPLRTEVVAQSRTSGQTNGAAFEPPSFLVTESLTAVDLHQMVPIPRERNRPKEDRRLNAGPALDEPEASVEWEEGLSAIRLTLG